jgi:predicted GH43/DUF377 family glycosyl hydrolase
MYFRGQGKGNHDQIGIAYADRDKFNGVDWKVHPASPVIKVSEEKSDFDCRHILDPGCVEHEGKVFLYYSGHSYDKPAGIGLAVSEDSVSFKKTGCVLENAIAPEVVLKDGVFNLIYQRKNEKEIFEFYMCESRDGIHFDTNSEKKIFSPSGSKGEFDSHSVSTCRIWREKGMYYMIYGGCPVFADYPVAFGLARSEDLLNWERCPTNPVMARGKAGEWDEGAIWFGTVHKHGDTRYLWYEGTGAGLGTGTTQARQASELCRTKDYGGYANLSFSQIGMAVSKGDFEFDK